MHMNSHGCIRRPITGSRKILICTGSKFRRMPKQTNEKPARNKESLLRSIASAFSSGLISSFQDCVFVKSIHHLCLTLRIISYGVFHRESYFLARALCLIPHGAHAAPNTPPTIRIDAMKIAIFW